METKILQLPYGKDRTLVCTQSFGEDDLCDICKYSDVECSPSEISIGEGLTKDYMHICSLFTEVKP